MLKMVGEARQFCEWGVVVVRWEGSRWLRLPRAPPNFG